MEVFTIQALRDEFCKIIKQSSAINSLTSKSIRPTPAPRVNLPVPKVAT